MLKVGNGKLDLVLTIAGKDIEYFPFINTSIRLFGQEFKSKWIIVPDIEYNNFRSKFPSDYNVIIESELVPKKPGGWFYQQFIKLAASKVVENDFYLIMDADIILIKPFKSCKFIIDNKAAIVRHHYPHDDEQANLWSDWASKTIKCFKPEFNYHVTPAFFNKHVVQSLINHCGGLDRLYDKLPWTECCLYGTYLEHKNIFNKYHINSKEYLHPCWLNEQFEDWDVIVGVKNPYNYFSLIQSNLHKSFDQIREKYKSIFPTLIYT